MCTPATTNATCYAITDMNDCLASTSCIWADTSRCVVSCGGYSQSTCDAVTGCYWAMCVLPSCPPSNAYYAKPGVASRTRTCDSRVLASGCEMVGSQCTPATWRTDVDPIPQLVQSCSSQGPCRAARDACVSDAVCHRALRATSQYITQTNVDPRTCGTLCMNAYRPSSTLPLSQTLYDEFVRCHLSCRDGCNTSSVCPATFRACNSSAECSTIMNCVANCTGKSAMVDHTSVLRSNLQSCAHLHPNHRW